MRICLIAMTALIPLVPATFAQDDKAGPADVAKEAQDALGKNDVAAFKAAIGRAVEVYASVGEKKGGALVSVAEKGLGNKESEIGIAAAEALGKMPGKASAKALKGMLKVPPKPDGNRLPVHKAAITACGVLAQPESLKDLEKLIQHKDPEIAVLATESLGGFKSLDEKQLDALIGRLVKSLAGFEKKIAKLKGKDGGAEAEKVQGALNGALAKLTGQTLSTSSDWAKWVKESKKAEKAE